MPSTKREERKMRKALCAAALILALTCSARAGWISNGIQEPPPLTSSDITRESVSTNSVSADEDATGATDDLTLIVLTTLVSVLP
jgi:hypothetical protein